MYIVLRANSAISLDLLATYIILLFTKLHFMLLRALIVISNSLIAHLVFARLVIPQILNTSAQVAGVSIILIDFG